MGTDVAIPVQKKMAAAYRSMTPEEKELADRCRDAFRKLAVGSILVAYDIGAWIHEALEDKDETKYRPGYMQRLTEAIGQTDTTLYGLRQLATNFEKEYLQTETAKPLADGSCLTLTHWTLLGRCEGPKEQERMLRAVRTNSWSAAQLERELQAGAAKTKKTRAGGRKQSAPSSPAAGLVNMTQISVKFINMMNDVAGMHVFKAINDIGPDDANAALLDRLVQAKNRVNELVTVAEQAAPELDECIEHVKSQLKLKEETEDDAAMEEKAKVKKDKKEKVKAAPKASKKSAPKPKKAKSKKGRKPVPATV